MKIKELFDSKKLFFISDPHLGHANIIKYTNRPFESVEEMSDVIISNWNKRLNEESDIFVLGDFFFKTKNSTIKWLLEKLVYNRMYLVIGNHDHRGALGARYLREYFTDIADRYEIRVDDDEVSYDFQTIILDHYPMLSWNHKHRGAWHLYGHVHGTIEHPDPNTLEVCVEQPYMNYTPISYEEVKSEITVRNLNK